MIQLSLLISLARKKKFNLKVEGTSMLPILQPGDVLSLEKTGFARIRENDVALVIRGRQPMIHRVIYKTKNYLVTRGDHSMKSDGRIRPKQVYAKVVEIRRDSQKFRLEDYYLIQSSRYFKAIATLCDVFIRENINFVILKGLPLHLFYERTHPKRIYADFDVMINPTQLGKTDRILIRHGYECLETSYSSTHKRLKDKPTSLSYHKHTTDFPVALDLHLEPVFLFNQLGRLDALYPQQLLDQMTKEFLQNKQWVTIQNHRFPILSPAHLFVYLCLHFFHHNFRGIYRLRLIDSVLRKYYKQRNFSKGVSEVIHKYRVGNFLSPALSIVKLLMQTPIPKQLLSLQTLDRFAKYRIQKHIIHTPVFDDEGRLQAGMVRFINLFILSPQPMLRRLTIVFDFAVWYSIVWSIGKIALRPRKIKAEFD